MTVKTADGGTKSAEELEAERLKQEQDAAEEARLAAEAANLDPATGKPKVIPPADDADEIVVTIGSEDAPASEEDDPKFAAAPEWVKELRKQQRETARENRELKAKLEAKDGSGDTKVTPTDPGPKPKLEDYSYDAEKYGTELEAWHEKRIAAEQVKREQEESRANEKKAWQATLDAYNVKKAALKVKDIDEVEASLLEVLNVTQQGIILQGSDNAALVVLALGKNPKKAKEIAAIKDPVKFAFAIAKLEKDLKVTKRKAPDPEDKPDGGSGVGAGEDAELERLRAEAAKTGDLSKVVAYKTQQRKAASG